jgi:hypothetical protein
MVSPMLSLTVPYLSLLTKTLYDVFPPNLKRCGKAGKISPGTFAYDMEFRGPPVFLFLPPLSLLGKMEHDSPL